MSEILIHPAVQIASPPRTHPFANAPTLAKFADRRIVPARNNTVDFDVQARPDAQPSP